MWQVLWEHTGWESTAGSQGWGTYSLWILQSEEELLEVDNTGKHFLAETYGKAADMCKGSVSPGMVSSPKWLECRTWLHAQRGDGRSMGAGGQGHELQHHTFAYFCYGTNNSTFYLKFLNLKKYYLSIVDLQCCVISAVLQSDLVLYIYMYFFSYSLPLWFVTEYWI